LEGKEVQLEEIERLLSQSMNGIHALFDNAVVAQILQKPTEELDFFNFKNLDRIQTLFTEFVNLKTVWEKQCFLNALDSKSYEILVRTYFHIVDNSLLASNPLRH